MNRPTNKARDQSPDELQDEARDETRGKTRDETRDMNEVIDEARYMNRVIDEACSPYATPQRAAEIALQDKFGLEEFTELTGIGIGDFLIYRVDAAGVSLRISESLAELTAGQQNAIRKAVRQRQLTLAFPCAPAEFVTWYDATRGEKAHTREPSPACFVSDFPLAEGFLEALNLGERGTAVGRGKSVPKPKIIDAFRVKTDETKNRKWWDDRTRSAIKYKLEQARVSCGRGKNPPRWDPLQIAIWLVAKNHLSADRVRRAVEAHFPEVDSSLL